jgi:hypothetical protein
MKTFSNRHNAHSDILEFMAQAQVGDLPSPVLPDHLKQKLAQLTLLYGVPVEYLIPDLRLLPTESLRFFYIDRNWLDRLVDGALSVGVLSTQDAVFNLSFFKKIYQQIDIEQLQFRSSLRGIEAEPQEETGGQITGFILRSQIVADFPGLEVNLIKGDKTLPILRMDTLSPNTLLCLVYGVPDKVELIQPGEGLQFGIFPQAPEADKGFYIFLRGLGNNDLPAGKQIDDGHGQQLKANGTFRSNNSNAQGVLRIKELVDNIKQTLPPGTLKDDDLTPGGFAIQLTKTAQKQIYDSDIKFPPCRPSDINQKGENNE